MRLPCDDVVHDLLQAQIENGTAACHHGTLALDGCVAGRGPTGRVDSRHRLRQVSRTQGCQLLNNRDKNVFNMAPDRDKQLDDISVFNLFLYVV